MIEATTLGNLFLIGNSFLTIGLILNQNESGKESFTQMKNFTSNPLEKITWICFLFQLCFLLIDIKLTDFSFF
jgi:succinate dehydrogenase/fumarate reductase cytochrome b subunit